MTRKLIFIAALLLCISCGDEEAEETTSVSEPSVPLISYSIKNRFLHDTTLFTEGFLFHAGLLYESTGSPKDIPETRSLIGVLDYKKGVFTQKIEIDRNLYFGEGIVFLNNKLYQLTYRTNIGFIYDAKTFKQTGSFSFSNKEGWALTTDGTHLIMSDGTSTLTYLDTAGLKPVKTLSVTESGVPVHYLNELEFIQGFIYANVYSTGYIVKIDPASGKVVGKLDLNQLIKEAEYKNPESDVLNGIAYDPATDMILVTGKFWPDVYQLEFQH